MIFMKINDFHQNYNFHRKINDFQRKINDFQRKINGFHRKINTFSSASEIVHSHDFRHLSRKMWKMLQLNGPPPAGVGAKGIHHAEGGRGGAQCSPPQEIAPMPT